MHDIIKRKNHILEVRFRLYLKNGGLVSSGRNIFFFLVIGILVCLKYR